MGKLKNFSVAVSMALVLFSMTPAVVFAEDIEPSSDQLDTISQSCSTLKQNLKTIQRTDSRTRSYLGSIYQTFLTNYITPLNLSLVKNNQPSTTITSLYSDFLNARSDFSDKFTTYSQSYEELLKIDCKENPGVFYGKLSEVRTKRAELNASTKRLRTLLSNFYIATTNLKENA